LGQDKKTNEVTIGILPELKPEDSVLLYWDFEKYTLDSLQRSVENLRSWLNHQTIIVLPIETNLVKAEKEDNDFIAKYLKWLDDQAIEQADRLNERWTITIPEEIVEEYSFE